MVVAGSEAVGAYYPPSFRQALTTQEDYLLESCRDLVLATSGGAGKDVSNQLPNVQYIALVLTVPLVHITFPTVEIAHQIYEAVVTQ